MQLSWLNWNPLRKMVPKAVQFLDENCIGAVSSRQRRVTDYFFDLLRFNPLSRENVVCIATHDNDRDQSCGECYFTCYRNAGNN